MTRDQLATLARRLLDGCRDSVTGEKLYGGESSTASVEDVEAAARYLRDCAEAEPVAFITRESMMRLSNGGNDSRGTVPVHPRASAIANRPLYLHPPEPARQPMTDEQRMLLIMAAFDAVKKPIVVAELCMEITRAVEAFHRIGSEGAKR